MHQPSANRGAAPRSLFRPYGSTASTIPCIIVWVSCSLSTAWIGLADPSSRLPGRGRLRDHPQLTIPHIDRPWSLLSTRPLFFSFSIKVHQFNAWQRCRACVSSGKTACAKDRWQIVSFDFLSFWRTVCPRQRPLSFLLFEHLHAHDTAYCFTNDEEKCATQTRRQDTRPMTRPNKIQTSHCREKTPFCTRNRWFGMSF